MKKLKNFIESVFSWITGLFKDEKGTPSSKRFVGIMCSSCLCLTLYTNSFTEAHFTPSDTLVNAVALLGFGCLGLSSVDKFTATKKNISSATETSETE